MKRWRAAALSMAVALGAVTAPAVQAQPRATIASTRSLSRVPFTRAEVASSDGHGFVVTWAAGSGAGPVEVFARSSPEPAGGADWRLVGRGRASGELAVSDLPRAARWYFELRPRRGEPLVIADRSLHLATAPNFRDIGGYRTTDGRWVRMGLVYRSDQLDHLSSDDLTMIGQLASSLVVDLRTEKERRAGPDRLPPGARGLVADVMADSPPDTAAILRSSAPDSGVEFLTEASRQFVSLPSAKAAYANLLSQILSAEDPVVYHCTAGKDRTGWGTAVLLTALGVPRQTVMADYLASNGYLLAKNKALFASMPPATAAKMEPIMTVRAAYLQAAFDEVDHRYGSFDRYLRDGLGVDDRELEKLRARFLAGAPNR
jgi:protein-tyrosine phosphatase